jgi:hypothetical protein
VLLGKDLSLSTVSPHFNKISRTQASGFISEHKNKRDIRHGVSNGSGVNGRDTRAP